MVLSLVFAHKKDTENGFVGCSWVSFLDYFWHTVWHMCVSGRIFFVRFSEVLFRGSCWDRFRWLIVLELRLHFWLDLGTICYYILKLLSNMPNIEPTRYWSCLEHTMWHITKSPLKVNKEGRSIPCAENNWLGRLAAKAFRKGAIRTQLAKG